MISSKTSCIVFISQEDNHVKYNVRHAKIYIFWVFGNFITVTRTKAVETNFGNAWVEVANMPIPLTSLSLSFDENEKKVYAFGGFSGSSASKNGLHYYFEPRFIKPEIILFSN
jgi:hypothetical protein